MHVASFVCGVWFGVCTTVTLLVVLDVISKDDDDNAF